MSLILEALKKLERDRPAGDRGNDVVLLAPVRWPARPARARWIAALLVLLVLAAGTGTALLLRRPRRAPAPERPAVVAGPASPAAPPAEITPSPSIAAALPPPPAPSPARRALPVRPLPVRDTPPPTPAPAAFVLTAIGEQDGHAVAVINERMVRVGDSLEGARVLRIGESEVELEAGGRHLTVGF